MKPKRNAANSRARLLAAAKQCFSEHGYSATGIRDVAEVAGVSYALLSRYFGSKAGLLEAALTDALKDKPFLEVPRAEFGKFLAKLIADYREGSYLPTAMTVLAAADPEARKIATRVVEAEIIGPIATWLGAPDARRRATAITMLGAGFVTHAHLLQVARTADLKSSSSLVKWLADSFQRIVDE